MCNILLKAHPWIGRAQRAEPNDDEHESLMSFKRPLYWLWTLVVTAQYKPIILQEPMDPFPLRRNDILPLCELSIWIGTAEQMELLPLYDMINRIYRRRDRKRCAQSRRWQLCCQPIWGQPELEKAREKHRSLDLKMRGKEPPCGPYDLPIWNIIWYSSLKSFIVQARICRSRISWTSLC